jgi:hypothetical protein
MVIDGNTIPKKWVALATVVGQRVRLPPEFARLAGLSGAAPVDCWLAVLRPGRFQLRKQLPRPNDGPAAQILDHLEELSSDDSVDGTESNEQIAVRARLLSCVVTGPRSGPRVNLPKEIFHMSTGERSHIYLLNVGGYVELWFPATFQEAVSVPISEVLP